MSTNGNTTTPDTATEWRAFFVEVEAPGFGPGYWIREQVTSVRPGDSLAAIIDTLSHEYDGRGVRLVPFGV